MHTKAWEQCLTEMVHGLATEVISGFGEAVPFH